MMELTLPCPICSGRAFKFFEHVDSFLEKATIFKCLICGHGFYPKSYSTKQLNDVYQESYAENYLNKEVISNKLRHKQYLLDVELLLSVSKLAEKPGLRVLDYGCSSGAYLDAMPALWEKAGFEVNPFHIDYLAKKNYTIFNSLDLIDENFDLITMRGVIEHISQHKPVINFFKKRLKLGGSVFISATPDFGSVCAALYKAGWNQVCCPVHIHQFTVASLSILFADAGLVLHSLSYPYENTPYANWSSDSQDFMHNFDNKGNNNSSPPPSMKHAFPGNMMSALYIKVR